MTSGWGLKQSILAGSGSLLLADSLIFLALRKVNAGTLLPGAIGLGLLLVALGHIQLARWQANRPFRLAWRGVCLGFFLWLASLGTFVGWNLAAGGHDEESPAATPYLIVLGAGLQGREPSLTLQYRLDRALASLQANPLARVIVSGGQGSNEEISEADAMQAYLVSRGLPATRIILEDNSTTTQENLQFSRRLLEAAGIDPATTPVGIVTSDFHALRAHRLALKAGYRQVWIASAPVPWWIRPNSWLREYFSVCLAILRGSD